MATKSMNRTQQQIAELERKLVAEKKEHFDSCKKELLARAEELGGRCFSYCHLTGRHGSNNRISQCVSKGLVRYGEAKDNSYGQDRIGVRIETWRIFTYVDDQLPRKGGAGARIEKTYVPYWEDVDDQRLGDLIRGHRAEIGLSEFKRVWTSVDLAVRGFGRMWDEKFAGTQPLPAFGPEARIPLDIPHLVLEPHETTFLSGHHEWMLDGGVFLVTPGSAAWAMHRLDERASKSRLGSQFYEACDWAHVHREEDTISRLRTRLLEVAK